MCGIAGILHYSAGDVVDPAVVHAMTDALAHRGPDADGFRIEPRVGIGARRLRIIDLETGDQPISNEDGTVWVALNGEVYNYLELQANLIRRGHTFRSSCDTEVLVHLYEEDGIECVQRCRGMFAFAVWDAKNRNLMLARDRFGIKPLFVTEGNGRMAFASEIKSLLHLPWIDRSWSPEGLNAYLQVGYVPSPLTAFRGIRKMEPGSVEVWHLDGDGRKGGCVEASRYWQPRLTPRQPAPTFADAKEQAETLLKESIGLHLRSDVPLGAFLSGGVDSSTVVAMMRSLGIRDLKTYSVGFEGDGASELPYAERVARHLETDHHAEVISSGEARHLPKLLERFDEPFADSSAIPTYFVSRLARQDVTVSLSGDGGDELFAGYPLYAPIPYYQVFDRMPLSVRSRLRKLAAIAIHEGARGGGFVRRLDAPPQFRFFALKYGQAHVDSSVFGALSREFASFLRQSDDAWQRRFQTDGRVEDALRIDQTTYMVDDVLSKVDRSSMAVSLEVRVPLLDHVFADQVNSLPLAYKLHHGQHKVLLKAMARSYLPPGLFDRPKQGFAAPLLAWLRGPLGDFVEERLLGDDLGLFNQPGVGKLLDLVRHSQRDFSSRAWMLLSLAAWADAARGGAPW